MKPKEVRIGNLIEYNGETFEIDSIAKVFPTLNTDRFGIGVVDWNNINPIELNEYWLLLFGFERWQGKQINEHESYTRWVLHNVVDGTGNFEVHVVTSNYGGEEHVQNFFSIDDDRQFIEDTDYVHNLQNHFYFSVGCELPYKNPQLTKT